MNFQKSFFKFLLPRFSNGLFLKLRHAYPNTMRMLRAFRHVEAEHLPPSLREHILVVGLGPAALACLRELKREGFTQVTVVAKDQLFGGKCVNFGCMPIEYTLQLNCPMDQRREKVQVFIKELRHEIEEQFIDQGYALLKGEAVEVRGKTLHLADGSGISFDRLILAIGNQATFPERVPADLPTMIDLNGFWHLTPSKKVTIYAGTNATALALGDVALSLGLEPTILLTLGNPFNKFPSYRFFLRELGKRGVKILENCRILSINGTQVQMQSSGKTISLEHDHFLFMDRPEPCFLTVDGIIPDVYDLDLRRACLPVRPDVVFLGDGGGLFTAAEADLQARILIEGWKKGMPSDLRKIDVMPFYIHARQSLAMVGAEHSYATDDWAEIDFRSLGWSKAHNLKGKLWYLLDKETGQIVGIHICHALATELISLGAVLMEFPVWDIKWQNTSTHPSASEIFKILADHAIKSTPSRSGFLSNLPDIGYQEFEFRLPPLDTIDPMSLPFWISREQFLQVIMSRKPHVCLASYYALSKLVQVTCNSNSPWNVFLGRLTEDRHGGYYAPCEASLKFRIDADSHSCTLEYEKFRVIVNWEKINLTNQLA